MKKIERLWARFLMLAEEETRLNHTGMGEREIRPAYLVNVFTSSGIRRVRAMQLLSDIRKELEKMGISEDEFLVSHGQGFVVEGLCGKNRSFLHSER